MVELICQERGCVKSTIYVIAQRDICSKQLRHTEHSEVPHKQGVKDKLPQPLKD